MTTYPSLKRFLAAALTLLIVGVPIVLFLNRGNGSDSTPNAPNAVAAQEPKTTSGSWAMYGGSPSRNMANTTVKNLPVKWVDKDGELIATNIKWVADLGSKAYGGPTVADGRVFIGTNNQNPRDKNWIKLNKLTGKVGPVDLGVVMCFDAGKGDFLWQSVFEKLPGGQVVDWPLEGICSSPTIEGDRAYFVSNRCEVVCADVKTGKSIWKLDMINDKGVDGKKLGVFPHNLSDCSPLLVGAHLWVVTSNGVNEDHLNVPAPQAPSFIKVDKANGKVLWQDNSPSAALLVPQKGNAAEEDFFKQLVNRGELIQHGQWANPSYAVVDGAPQVIFPGGDGWIYSFDPAGKLIWRFDCNPKDAKYELKGKGTRSDFIGTPVVYKDRVYIGIGQDPEHRTGVGHLWCIDMKKKGDVSPELVVNNAVFPPVTKPNPNSALVWHYGGVIQDPALAKKMKRNYYFGRTMSTCAIHEGLVYVAELARLLHCLDADTGKVYWEFDTEADIWSSPYYADGKIYLGNDEGTVFVFEHGKKLKKLAENNMGGRVRATPVAADGTLYVMTENKLYAIKK